MGRAGKGRAGLSRAWQGHSSVGRAGEGQALTSVGSVAALAQKRLLRAMPVWSVLPAAGGEGVSVPEMQRRQGDTCRLTWGAVRWAAGHPLQCRLQGLAECGAGRGARGSLCADLWGDGVVG